MAERRGNQAFREHVKLFTDFRVARVVQRAILKEKGGCEALAVAMTKQTDLFKDVQLGLNLGDSAAAVPINAHAVRLQLNALIEQAKCAQDTAPWDHETRRQHQLAFPQLAKILPSEEAVFLTRQFEFELARLERFRAV